jgi:hypothetical protein
MADIILGALLPMVVTFLLGFSSRPARPNQAEGIAGFASRAQPIEAQG